MIDFDIEILFLGGFDKRSAKCKSNNSRLIDSNLIWMHPTAKVGLEKFEIQIMTFSS